MRRVILRRFPITALLAAGLLMMAAEHGPQAAPVAQIRIDAARKLHRITPRFIGVNLEDLNSQCYGGLYSQLLFGESFQEHVDSAVLGLEGKDRLKVFVGENDQGQIELWGFRGRVWEHNAAREALGLPLRNNATPVSLEELPAETRQALLHTANAGRQVSRHWRAFEQGSARGSFRFERAAPFIGRQSQRLSFDSGAGELGIDNAGLNRWGIRLVAGKPYEGLLRIRAERDTTVWVSLRDSNGSKKLAEKSLRVSAGAEYRRLEFTLTASAGDDAGRFAISLKQPGSIAVGYAFLQPGPWGRFAGLPVRKDLVEALKEMGVTAIRYDGSMINKLPDGHLYKWKEMIGPRDLRKPYRGYFNPYASHGFGIFDFLNLCEAAGFLPIPGLRTDETPEDLQDFIEYVNGPADSRWGRRRAADGHPAPYRLRHLEIGNEERLDEAYCERFETLARALWEKDPAMILLVTHNLESAASFTIGPNGEVPQLLRLAERLVRFARDRKGTIWWDCHYRAMPNEFERGIPARIAAMAALRASMRRLVPEYDLPIAPLEENGAAHDLQRALTHARNQNAFARMGDYLPVIAVANALQAYDQDLTWSQGRVHFTPSQVILQPPYYVDQMVTQAWAPRVVETAVSGAGPALDVNARISEDGRRLALYAVNDSAEVIEADLLIRDFRPQGDSASVVELAGAPLAVNSPAQPAQVAPRRSTWTYGAQLRYRFPAHSFTIIEFQAGP
jgi:alpha-L-arabinofuranosidase